MLPGTERQVEILNFIVSFAAKRGIAPSYAVIGRHIGVKSRATVAKHVKALERRGLLKREGDQRSGTFALRVSATAIRCPKCNHEFMRDSGG